MAGLRHGDGSAAWLEARGLGELSPLVRDHPVPRLADDGDAARLAAAPSRRGSSPTPTSGPASASSPWPRGSPRGGAGTRPGPRSPCSGRTTGRRADRAGPTRRPPSWRPARMPSNARSAASRAWSRTGSGASAGPAARSAGHRCQAAAHEAAATVTVPVIAYYRGGDGFALDRAVAAIARRLEQETGAAPDRWRVDRRRDERRPDRRARRHGPDVRRRDAWPWSRTPGRSSARRTRARRWSARCGVVAPGNALVFVEQGDAGSKRAAMLQALEAAVLKAGGEARAFAAPRAGELAGWLRNLATERGVTLDRDASEELARRVGGFVTEGDVDRQRQGALAAGGAREAGPLPPGGADHRRGRPGPRPGGDPGLHVGDARRGRGAPRRTSPARCWTASSRRRPCPVIIVQLHRRLRELLIAADLAAARPPPAGHRQGHRRPPVPGAEAGRAGAALDAARARRRARGRAGAGRDDQGGGGLGEHGAPGAAGVHAVGPRAGRGGRRGPARAGRPAPGDRLGAAEPSVGGGPGLFLHDDVALDREHAAAVAEVEQLDQLGIDVQLVAVLAQARRGCRSTAARSGRRAGTSCRSG